MASITRATPQNRAGAWLAGLGESWRRLRVGWGAEGFLVAGLVLVGFVAHALNMFNFPAFTFKDDEGIYAAQAWAVLREGQLTPYTYFYDHAPVGWLFIAAWMGLSGGPHTFGGSIDSGRVLMLLLHLAMIPLLYNLARKLGASVAAAAVANLFFSLSPLAIFYQRMLLLDTVMLFLVLLSLNLLLDGWGRLSRFLLSGLCFGLALLTKETAVFLLPVMLLIAWQQRRAHQGRFALAAWLLPMLGVVSWYPLYALFKGELLPAGKALSFLLFNIQTGTDRVSLLDALRWQASRGGGGLFNLDNMFWQLVRTEWFPRDPLLAVGGAAAVGLNLLHGLRNRQALVVALLGLLPLFYLGRGGVVFDYYVLFALPFVCLNLALLLDWVPRLKRLPVWTGAVLSGLVGAGLLVGYWLGGLLLPLYTERPADAGRAAISWIKQNIPADSRIITRDDLWTDLREPGLGGPGFPNVHSHWKVASDPAIKNGVFGGSGQNVDYLIMSPGVEAAFKDTGDTVALEALANAQFVKKWQTGSTIVELWKVNKVGETEQNLLSGSRDYLSSRFEEAGAYADREGVVTSEAQAQALLRAVWSSDRAEFKRVWEWTGTHLLGQDGLLAMRWQAGSGATTGRTRADADSDTALALLLAGRTWNDPTLLAAGKAMAGAIWQHEVVSVKGQPYLAAGNWAVSKPQVALNPGSFAPYAYAIFGEVDPAHDWPSLIDSTYRVLFAAQTAPFGATRTSGLPPDWIGLDRTSGSLSALPLAETGTDTTGFSDDAARVYWRIGLDWRWRADGRAQSFLQQAAFLRDEVERKGRISAAYGRDGSVITEASSLSSTAGGLAALLTLDPKAANRLYASGLVGTARPAANGQGTQWGQGDDLTTQEWGWLGTAFYANALPDLWHATDRLPKAAL